MSYKTYTTFTVKGNRQPIESLHEKLTNNSVANILGLDEEKQWSVVDIFLKRGHKLVFILWSCECRHPSNEIADLIKKEYPTLRFRRKLFDEMDFYDSF